MKNDVATILLQKIIDRIETYNKLNQAKPKLEDDATMDSLMEQLLDELGCTAE